MRLADCKLGALALLSVVSAVTVPMAAPAAPAIAATIIPSAGSIACGDSFTVVVRISGYMSATQIDGCNFNVSYDSARFSFVAGSFALGASSGSDQQWLSKATQDAGYSLSDFSDASVPGTVAISLVDLGAGSPQGGTVAADGFIVSFRLQAVAPGAGSITCSPGAGGTVLYDTSLNPAGTSSFNSAVVTVVGPRLDITRNGNQVTIFSPKPGTLQQATTVTGLWSDLPAVPGATNISYTTTTSGPRRFFRLKIP